MRLPEHTPDILRQHGLTVVEIDGWQGRGRAFRSIEGIVNHHDGTTVRWTREQLVDLLADGREDLAGPLANFGVERDGTVLLVADGRCNHAGFTDVPWLDFDEDDRRDPDERPNDHLVSIEPSNNGRGEAWPDVQADALVTLNVAVLDIIDREPSRVTTHSEFDTRGKPDPAGPVWWQPEGGTWDPDTFRGVILDAWTTNGDDMTPEESRMLTELHRVFVQDLPADAGTDDPSDDRGHRHAYAIQATNATVARIEEQVDELRAMVTELAGDSPNFGLPIDTLADRVADRLAARLAD